MSQDRYERLVRDFLGKRRIAIWGIEEAKSDPGNWIVSRLRKRGAQVFAVNPGFAVTGVLGHTGRGSSAYLEITTAGTLPVTFTRQLIQTDRFKTR